MTWRDGIEVGEWEGGSRWKGYTHTHTHTHRKLIRVVVK